MNEYKFDEKKTRDDLIQWIRDWFAVNGPDCNVVIGISGGKDSTIAAALCAEALGKERVIGVLMPNGNQKDISDSYRVVKHLGINYMEVNIAEAVNGIKNGIKAAQVNGKTNMPLFNFTNQMEFNIPPRVRIATLYAVSQCNNGRVLATNNYSETKLGWFTKGDNLADFLPFVNLTATEIIEIGKVMDLPIDLVVKRPADGLTAKTDEDNFGFTYAEFDKYLRTGVCENAEHKALMDARMKANAFKSLPIASFVPTLV